MVVDEAALEVTKAIAALGNIALWLQAIGAIIVLWIIFEVVMLHLNLRRMREVYKIKEDMKRIEGKIDRILRILRGR